MKLDQTKITVESSGEMAEQFFSIQDTGMIFDILRNKMYSNPILAICREISCNARDAHREVGKEDVQVEIQLPNSLDPSYKIKDFGPGISPDRMSNIFIKYTASTKRDDNVQTGGFGLGAKTPFSYSDSFGIITNVDGIQYNYACFIDETKVGKLALMSSAPTEECNGTTIIIPVKPADFNYFRDYTEQATRFWKVRPIVRGARVEFQSIEKTIEGTDWVISSRDRSDYGSNGGVKLVIDGVEYPVDLTALKKYADTKVIHSCYGTLFMFFGVGEISLSASREQVSLDKNTQEKISKKLDDVANEICKIVSDKIEAFPNYWDANVFYKKELQKTFHNIKFLGKLNWRGLELHDYSIQLPVNIFNFSKSNYYSKATNGYVDKIRRSQARQIVFDSTSVLVINDLTIKEPTPRHIKKLFDDNKDLASVQVVCPSDTNSLQDLNTKFNLDKMEYKLLSSLTKATGHAYKAPANRLLVFKFDNVSCAFRQVPYDSIEEDTKTIKILCKLTKSQYPGTSRYPLLTGGKSLAPEMLSAIAVGMKDVSIYGVDSSSDQNRIEEDFENFVDFDSFLKENVVESKKIDYVKLKAIAGLKYDLNERLIRLYPRFKSEIINSNSIFLKKLEAHTKIKEISDSENWMLKLYETISKPVEDKLVMAWLAPNPDFNMSAIDEACDIKYPLLKHVNIYNYDRCIDDIAHYINLADK